jgi:hypothetical protein
VINAEVSSMIGGMMIENNAMTINKNAAYVIATATPWESFFFF